MSWLYRTVARPWLFGHESEDIHNLTLNSLGWISQQRVALDLCQAFCESPSLPSQVCGLHFPNPVGLAAGMDKQAAAVPAWAALGFGFSELGGVTWHPQSGNPAPRMFRAVEDEALINRMGFNNGGAQAMAARLENWRASGFWPGHPVGINLGKSKITPLESATEDYLQSFQVLWPWADFFVVNVSSPNTPNLRELQEKAALSQIIHALQTANRDLAGKSVSGRARPILIKVAPDLTDAALDDVLEVAEESGVAGIVATNTTIDRPVTSSETARQIYAQTGGLSGKPLRARSTAVIRYIFERTGGFLPIIGVGGIFSAQDAWEKIIAGASLVQIYTGLVYEGPGLAGAIVRGIMERMEEAGISNMAEATGSDVD